MWPKRRCGSWSKSGGVGRGEVLVEGADECEPDG
jgi:hypothetical protein